MSTFADVYASVRRPFVYTLLSSRLVQKHA